jgi:hypothetical protein
MTIDLEGGFGTRSSSLIALPAAGGGAPVWRFAEGLPDRNPYREVDLH